MVPQFVASVDAIVATAAGCVTPLTTGALILHSCPAAWTSAAAAVASSCLYLATAVTLLGCPRRPLTDGCPTVLDILGVRRGLVAAGVGWLAVVAVGAEVWLLAGIMATGRLTFIWSWTGRASRGRCTHSADTLSMLPKPMLQERGG